MSKLGTVYFIQIDNADGYVKIGFSSNINGRMSQLRVGCPYNFKLLTLAIDESKTLEKVFHNLLKESHLVGEWFYPTEEVMECINVVKKCSSDKLAQYITDKRNSNYAKIPKLEYTVDPG